MSAAPQRSSLSPTTVAMLVALVAIPRLVLIFFYPEIAGDSENYKNVAANVLRGCGLSMSPADGSECIPHQGGQNLPGLPLYIAAVWLVFGRSDHALLLVQLGLYLAAIGWLLIITARFETGRTAATVLAVLLAVSPMAMPWVRFVAITEVLSLTCSIWVLAEILRSIQTSQFQGLRLALAFAAAVFMRVENVLLLLPLALTAVYTYGAETRRRAAIFLVAASLPFIAFVVRNVTVGLPPVSSPAEVYKYAVPSYPHGFLAWLDTWMVTEYQRADVIMGVWGRKYTNILVQRSKFIGVEERRRVDTLLAQLRNYDGGAFPAHIDEQFAALAREKRRSQTVADRLEIYLTRSRWLWLNPYSSYGFPIETQNREHRAVILRELEQPGAGKYLKIVREYPVELLGRVLIILYKVAILAALGLSLFLLRRKDLSFNRVVSLVLLTVISRTVFLVLLGNPPQLEARYVVSVVPWAELLAALVFARLIVSRGIRRGGTTVDTYAYVA